LVGYLVKNTMKSITNLQKSFIQFKPMIRTELIKGLDLEEAQIIWIKLVARKVKSSYYILKTTNGFRSIIRLS
jgi:hypothetical protein